MSEHVNEDLEAGHADGLDSAPRYSNRGKLITPQVRVPGTTDPTLSANEKMLYDAILDVIDDCPRAIWDSNEDFANSERLDFARAVITRWRSLKTTDERNGVAAQHAVQVELVKAIDGGTQMTSINAEDLETGQIVMITATISLSKGFEGKLFKVLSVDYPYAVLLWLESAIQSRYTRDLREFTFAIPSKEYLEAAVPNEVWADVINTER